MSPHPRDGRDGVLARVRKSLGVGAEDADRRLTIQKRLYNHRRNIVPKRAQIGREDLVAQFKAMLEGQSASVSVADSADQVPELVAENLRRNNLPQLVRMGDDEFLVALDWERAPTLGIDHMSNAGDGDVGLSRAHLGVSEVGVLVLISGADNPTTLNFLPENHVVVVREGDIVGAYEDAWDRIRSKFGERAMPRAVNFVAGPSRTADIEQTIVMGAHGPRRLHVIIVKDD